YTVTVENIGATDIDQVTLTDVMGGNFTLTGPLSVSQGNCSSNGDTFFCQLGTLGSGNEATLSYTVNANAVGTLTNLAWAAGEAQETDPSDNYFTLNVPVFAQQGDISVTKTANVASALPGEPVEFIVTVANLSLTPINNVFVSDTLVGDFTVVTAPPGFCVPGGDAFNCAIGALAATGQPGDSVTFSYAVSGNAPGLLNNTAVANSEVLDPNPINNTVTRNVPITELTGNLSLVKQLVSAEVFLGAPLLYRITVTNQSAAEVNDVVVTDTLVGDFGEVLGLEACAANGDTFTCSPGSIPAGGTIAIEYSVVPAALGILSNIATVAGAVIDTVPGDNTATVNAEVVDPPPPNPGGGAGTGGGLSGGAAFGGCALAHRAATPPLGIGLAMLGLLISLRYI
ncbi:MAG: hypothetical protein ACREP8_06745, partial [Candidatus Binatia bacterium]